MDRNGAWNSLKYIFLAVFVLFLPFFAVAQSGDEVVDLLVELGFENVSWGENESERVYVLENTVYRTTGVGIGKALDEIQKHGLPAVGKGCRLIVLDNNVPQISLCCTAPEVGKELSRNDWTVSYDLGESWDAVKGNKKKNSSLYKVDLLVAPEFNFKNYKLSVPYEVQLFLNPTIRTSLWKGGELTAQLSIPVVNQYDEYVTEIKPGFVTLSHTLRFPYNILVRGTVGFYSWNRAGGDLSAKWYSNNGKFWVDGRLSYTAEGQWGEYVIDRGEWKKINPLVFVYDRETLEFTGYMGVNYYFKKFDTQMSAKYMKFLYGYNGVRGDLIRHFKNCSIGFYLMKVQDVSWNDGLTGGFMFQVTLPPFRYKRKGYIPRVMPSSSWGLSYNAAGTLHSGKMFRTDIDEFIVSPDVYFNPNYVKTELLNF